jgi:hypothetical protein
MNTRVKMKIDVTELKEKPYHPLNPCGGCVFDEDNECLKEVNRDIMNRLKDMFGGYCYIRRVVYVKKD